MIQTAKKQISKKNILKRKQLNKDSHFLIYYQFSQFY